MSLTHKAVRATIILGDIELDCYQMPDGTYWFGTNQIRSELQIQATNSTGKKYLKPLLEANPNRLSSAKTEGVKATLKLMSIDLITQAIGIYAGLGNQKCMAVAIACMAETLERRADSAFGKVRTEDERNERFIIRRDGIVSRHFWTDCIDAYCRSTEVSDNYKKWIYIQVSDMVNKAILGMTAKAYRESLGLPDSISTRNYLDTEQLKQIDTIEKAAGMRVKRDSLCPKQALKDVISLIG